MSTARVDFTRGAAERIARVVRIVEQGERDQSGPRYGKVPDDARSKPILRLCTFTGEWPAGTSKELTFQNQTSTPNTISVLNSYIGLDAVASCQAIVARLGEDWHLLQADLTKQRDYSTAGLRVFTVSDDLMNWASVTSCPTAQASAQALSYFQ